MIYIDISVFHGEPNSVVLYAFDGWLHSSDWSRHAAAEHTVISETRRLKITAVGSLETP